MTARHRDVIAVGASAGGVESLRALVAGLPPDLPASVLVVLHLPRDAPSALPSILDRSGPLPVAGVFEGERIRPGRIYVAPIDHHLLLLDGHLRLSHGPAENGHRPAIDPLFRSVARAAGPRGIGVVLSGSRDDGAAGLTSIVARGGLAVVQDPAEALYSSMPLAALARTATEHVAPAAKLGGLLAELTAMPLPDEPRLPADELLDSEVAMSDLAAVTTDRFAPPAGFGCPACGGGLFQIDDGPVPRYRCRIGHAWSPESLLDEQAIALEGALWMALRALEEKSELSRRMAANGAHRRAGTGARFDNIAADADAAGATIRRLIARLGAMPERGPDTAAPGEHPDESPSDVR
ncbi:chemotaxis protein CheB [Actinoplanes auranticolor]|uniref:protein-glutamate methylesterase n=1 Tax=Actinoplanes auranticolor TaxID=47988 RepID=A0A919SV63_9ACTN|nr:chemotaxis protein CheB [Actinoplanes auranticolor]GIM78950.1 chemotaxis protein CheB [Actinoplanes auranticolor]